MMPSITASWWEAATGAPAGLETSTALTGRRSGCIPSQQLRRQPPVRWRGPYFLGAGRPDRTGGHCPAHGVTERRDDQDVSRGRPRLYGFISTGCQRGAGVDLLAGQRGQQGAAGVGEPIDSRRAQARGAAQGPAAHHHRDGRRVRGRDSLSPMMTRPVAADRSAWRRQPARRGPGRRCAPPSAAPKWRWRTSGRRSAWQPCRTTGVSWCGCPAGVVLDGHGGLGLGPGGCEGLADDTDRDLYPGVRCRSATLGGCPDRAID